MTPEATAPGRCFVCTYELSVGEDFAWGEAGQRRHAYCDPPAVEESPELSEDDTTAIVEQVEDNLAARLLELHSGVDPESLAEMVALRLARPAEEPRLGLGPPIGTMACSRCGATWQVSDGAGFECPGCGYAA
ncbi:MAG: hypothetical protein KGI98_16960 [Euryarchaeota archaeon]|nr:hypothetical protein [Euryarchaeota archaeon]MDE1881833.1 hypothetical protein [Euryarchaeota archaeon]